LNYLDAAVRNKGGRHTYFWILWYHICRSKWCLPRVLSVSKEKRWKRRECSAMRLRIKESFPYWSRNHRALGERGMVGKFCQK
jgi:hypothetical protein